MAKWISSPLVAVARTAIISIDFLLVVIFLPRRCFCSSPYDSSSADVDCTTGTSIAIDPSTDILPFAEHYLTKLSSHTPKYRRSIFPSRSRRINCYNEALRILREMKNPNVFCYTTAIDALIRAGRCQEAESLFSEMILSGIAPDTVAYSVIVKLYAFNHQHFVFARNLIQLMADRGCQPDVVTYATLIAGFCRAGKVDDAISSLNSMLENNCMINAYTYTPIVQALCAQGKIDSAMDLLEKMRGLAFPPDTVCYNVLIHAFCKIGNFGEVERLLRESPDNGWEPDSVSYNTFISGLCHLKMKEEAIRQLDVMLNKGLIPTEVTLNILLGLLCRDSMAREIIFFIERSFELGLHVGPASYNTAMTRLCELRELSAVLKLLSDMIKKGIKPDVQTFNIVILSLCRVGKLYKAMLMFKGKGFVPDIVTCNILLHELCLKGEFDEFYRLISGMDSGDISPDAITYNIIVDGLCWDGKYSKAIEFVKSIDCEFKSDHVAHLAFGLVKGGRVGDLMRLLGEMIEEGFIMDARLFDFILQAFCKKGSCESMEIYKICLVLDKMLGREYSVH